MKVYEIVTRVQVNDADEAQFLMLPLDYAGEVECIKVRKVKTPPLMVRHKDGDPTNHDLDNLAVMPLYPPQVARAHAAELRQVLADLLEWNTGGSNAPAWQRAKRLMTQIRDEEDEAREER